MGYLILAGVAGLLVVPGVGRPSAAAIRGNAMADLARSTEVRPVEIVLAYASLSNTTVMGRAPLALPISFGRPVAPEDEQTAPPARWHRRSAHRHARRWAGQGYFLYAMIVPRMDRVAGAN